MDRIPSPTRLQAPAYRFSLTVHARVKKIWCDLGAGTSVEPALAREIDRLLLLLRE